MDLSYVEMNRIVEDKAASDEAYRKEIESTGRPLLSSGRAQSDESLVKKLNQLGIDLDRAGLDHFTRSFDSAEQLSRALIKESKHSLHGYDQDWVWIALVCLWERWFPDRPSMEMIDDRMQEGYSALEQEGSVAACRCWLDTWKSILKVMESRQIEGLAEFYDRFWRLYNWLQDFEMELGNAGLENPSFNMVRIEFCQAVMDHSTGWDLSMAGFKRAIADSYFRIGQAEKGEEIYRTWLEEEPNCTEGWVAWSDSYWFFAAGEKDARKAEEKLMQALNVAEHEEREYVLDRLQDLYEETGRKEEADAIRREADELRKPHVTKRISQSGNTVKLTETYHFGEEGIPLDQLGQLDRARDMPPPPATNLPTRAGRNDPCPCGSGRKFKRCCGKQRS